MSVEVAIDFLKKLESDDKFVEDMSAQPDKNAQVAFVKEQGFVFSVEDFQKAIHEHVEQYLSEDEIAGFTEGALLPGTLKWWKDLLQGGPNPTEPPEENSTEDS